MGKDDLPSLRQILSSPEVWAALDRPTKKCPDPLFLKWLRGLPCAGCGNRSHEYLDVVPHHIRRVQWGSGTGIKPAHCALPLCQIPCHTLVETDPKGDRALAPESSWEFWRFFYPTKWAGERMLQVLKFKTWPDVPRDILLDWVQHNAPILWHETMNAAEG